MWRVRPWEVLKTIENKLYRAARLYSAGGCSEPKSPVVTEIAVWPRNIDINRSTWHRTFNTATQRATDRFVSETNKQDPSDGHHQVTFTSLSSRF